MSMNFYHTNIILQNVCLCVCLFVPSPLWRGQRPRNWAEGPVRGSLDSTKTKIMLAESSFSLFVSSIASSVVIFVNKIIWMLRSYFILRLCVRYPPLPDPGVFKCSHPEKSGQIKEQIGCQMFHSLKWWEWYIYLLDIRFAKCSEWVLRLNSG